MLRSLCCLLALVWILAAPSVQAADDSPLAHFSSDVDVLIHLKEPDKSIEKLAALVDQVQPGAGQLVKQQTAALGQLISNPELTGVDQSRDWYAGVYADGEDEPTVVFAIPAVQSKDMLAALGDDVKSKVQGRWVLYTDAEEIPAVEGSNSALKLLGGSGLSALQGGDLTFYVNVAHLADVYSDQLDLIRDKTLDTLNGLRFAQPNGMNLAGIVEIYGKAAQAIFQGIEDGQSLTVSVSLTDAGISLDEFVKFKEGTEAAGYFSKTRLSAMSDLAKLPAGATIYYGASGGIEDLVKLGFKLTSSMLEKADAEKMDAALDKLEGVKFGTLVAALQVTDSPQGIFRGAGICDADPIEKFKAFTRDGVEAMAYVKLPGLTQDSSIQKDAETYGPYKADVATVKQQFDEQVDPTGMQDKIHSLMFGEDGMQTRTVYLEKQYVSTVGGGAPAMQALLDQMKSPKSNGIEAARKGLLKEASFLGFLDLPGTIGQGLKAASKVEGFPLPINADMIDNLHLKSSFIGFAAGRSGDVQTYQTRIPTEQILGMAKIVMMFSSIRGGL